MADNSFGQLFRFTTWGESHGPAIGVVIDGVPPRLSLDESDIQYWLDRRRPGQSQFVSQRKEPDTVKIMSGVFGGWTTGSPIALEIENVDQRSKDYTDIKDQFRPGHADYTYWAKYGIRDYRGGGRASARETACRVAAGAIARKVLQRDLPELAIRGALTQVGPHAIDRNAWEWEAVTQNPFWCPDQNKAEEWAVFLDAVRKDRSSAGAIVEVHAGGVPVGLGEPVYGKLDAELAGAMMSINAVKGVEIGDGFESAATPGEAAHDEMSADERGRIEFKTNRAGGVLGGISSGQDVVVRFVVKPTSSLPRPQRSVDVHGNEIEVETKGRHDPCVGIRAVPVGEAMMACVLADHWLRHRAQCG